MSIPAYYDDEGVLSDGEAWVAISSSEPDGDSSVTFSSTNDGKTGDFSQYLDLFVVLYGQGSGNDSVCQHRVHLNGVDAGGKYDKQALTGTGSAAVAGYATAENWIDLGPWPTTGDGATVFGTSTHHFFDINSGKYKSASMINGGERGSAGEVNLLTWTYRSQDPITSLTFKIRRGGSTLNWMAGSRLDLFGILPRMVV